MYLAKKTSNNTFFLNIGIAGHRDYKLGEIVLVSKVTDNKTKYNWYPSLLWETKIKTSPLVTVGFPKIRYKSNLLYDMDPLRQAEVMATIDEMLVMQNVKGMGPESIIQTVKESWKRKPSASGGLAGLLEV